MSRLGLLLLLVLAIFWGCNWPILKIVLREAPVFWFRLVCVWGAAIGLFAVARAGGASLKFERQDTWRLFVVSLFSIVGWNVLSGVGITLLPAGRASMLGYTMPLWLTLMAAANGTDPLNVRSVIGLVLGMGGVALLIGEDVQAFSRAPLGTLAMLGAAVSWAIGVMMLKRRPFALTPAVQTAWLMAIGGVPIAMVVTLQGQWVPPPLSTAAWLGVAYNVVIAGVICYWAFYKLVTLLPPSVVSISSLIVPVVGVLSAAWVLSEWPGVHEWLALALIVGALATVLLKRRA
jgi:drug/metabolite transporter (DMT)-like permease